MENTHPVLTDEKIINRILEKGIEQILPSKEELKKLLLSGKKLNIYQGFDPTGPTLHIGHTVGMRKLEDFRKLGHNVYFVIGDFTARVGDPSDKTSIRQKLTKEQVEANLKNYVQQAKNFIDIFNTDNPVKIAYNSTWLEPLNFGDILELSSEFTVQQMLKRSMFQKRIEQDKPISISEFMYPMMQGYDSVMMDIDIEIGGNDQLFNMMAGRDLVRSRLNKEKFVIAGKLLETPNGDKMGKTTGNMISLDENTNDIYGKVMALPDSLLAIGFEILTPMDMEEVGKIRERIQSGENPMTLKKELAFSLTREIRGEEEAHKAKNYFENIFQNKQLDENILEIEVVLSEIPITDLLVTVGLSESKGQARRLVAQGAVKINNERIDSWEKIVNTQKPFILKSGKKICKISKKT